MVKKISKLILIDHDGTLCQTNPFAFESIKYAALDSTKKLGLEDRISSSEWDNIFYETTGTTEKNLARHIANTLNIALGDYEQYFYSSRANWFQTMKNSQEFIFDTYYPDAEHLVNQISSHPDCHLMFVTGNPRSVMDVRLSTHLRRYFCDKNDNILGSFGDESFSRQDLIKKAINDAAKLYNDFSPLKNNQGFIDNVYYIGDGYKDFEAGIYCKVKTIWIPSRSLPLVKEKTNDQNIRLLMSVLGNNAIITNNLESKNITDFIGLN